MRFQPYHPSMKIKQAQERREASINKKIREGRLVPERNYEVKIVEPTELQRKMWGLK